jgi:hypothetical protein
MLTLLIVFLFGKSFSQCADLEENDCDSTLGTCEYKDGI